MTQNTVKTLLIVSAALLVLALMLSIIVIFVQKPLQALFAGSIPEGENGDAIRTAPYYEIITIFVYLACAAVALILCLNRLSRNGTIVLLIITAILFVLYQAVFSPLISMLLNLVISRSGTAALAAYTTLSSGTSLIVKPFVSAAIVLLFIALGGACGKNFTRN